MTEPLMMGPSDSAPILSCRQQALDLTLEDVPDLWSLKVDKHLGNAKQSHRYRD